MKRGKENINLNLMNVSILFGIFIILSLPFVSSLNTWDTGWSLPNVIKSIFVTDTQSCKIVNNPTSTQYFVPTKTSTEWNAFLTFASLVGISVQQNCCGNGIVNTGEQCDGSAGVPYCSECGSYSCSSSCTIINDCDVCPEPEPEPEPDPVDDGCFTSETLVKTLNGEKEISELKVGDSVLSYNFNTNKFVYSQIEKLLIHEDNTNWYYLIKTPNSQVEVTSVHPFYIGNGKYTQIENLNLGDKIYININGELVQEEILSKERIDLPKLITVYNLELNKDGPRNYFANGYLVHNIKVCLDCVP